MNKEHELFRYKERDMAFVRNGDRYFRCPSCGEVSTQNAWDRNTEPLCTNRMERRKYMSIGSNKGGRRWYKCPKCDKANYNHNIHEVSKDAYEDGITKRL
jgi:uncharacterized C2H2 Zn-finger protein